MERYDDLVELARICREQARSAKAKTVAAELRRMAKEYEKRASITSDGTKGRGRNPSNT
jgi:hypothetical protein